MYIIIVKRVRASKVPLQGGRWWSFLFGTWTSHSWGNKGTTSEITTAAASSASVGCSLATVLNILSSNSSNKTNKRKMNKPTQKARCSSHYFDQSSHIQYKDWNVFCENVNNTPQSYKVEVKTEWIEMMMRALYLWKKLRERLKHWVEIHLRSLRYKSARYQSKPS